VTTDRGLDPGAFPTLFAYGGAGPLHAVLVARELRIPKVVIPRAPGHFSAFGMLLSDFRRDLVRSRFARLDELDLGDLESWFAEMEQEGIAALREGLPESKKLLLGRSMDMRYVGQEHAVTVEVPVSVFAKPPRARLAAIKAAFDDLHRERYGRGTPEEPAEIVSIRSTVTGQLAKPPLAKIARGRATPPREAATGKRKVHFSTGAKKGGAWLDTATWRRDALLAGNRIAGPALVEEHASTTVVMPGDTLVVDAWGNLVITVGR